MNKLKIFLVLLGIYLIQSNVNAQVPVVGTDKILEKLRLNKSVSGPENISYSNITGEPYLYKNFEKAKLIMTSGEEFDINVRYDLYSDEMHLSDKGIVYAIGFPGKIERINTDTLSFIYSKFVKSAKEKNPVDGAYFIIKTDGTCKLLIKKNLRIQDAEPPKLYQDAKPARFIVMADTYFIKVGDNYAVKIKSKSDLLSVLHYKTDEIQSFITTNKLNVKEAEDLNKIILFYNTLK